MAKDGYIELEGKIVELLPNYEFKVKLENEHVIIAGVSGKIRMHNIRIYPGDRVLVEIPICDLTRGRIVYRY